MNILNLEDLTKGYGEKMLFSHISCGVQEGDKIGIIGLNGAGKSTLLKVLAGKEEADAGTVTKRGGLQISYLPQTPEFAQEETVRDYMMRECGFEDWDAENEAKAILMRFQITDFEAAAGKLSGGQKKRVALAAALEKPVDVLIMDEPTNHLDGEMTEWLEEFLRKSRKTLILVTHDRYFMDRVTNRILELEHGKLYDYAADYSGFLKLKAEREEMELASERKRKSVLRGELEWAKRGCRARTTKQKARLDRLEALKESRLPAEAQTVEFASAATRMGKKTIEFCHVGKSLGGRRLIDDFNYIVLKNQRLAFIGPNGCGKSTLMRILCGITEPDEGHMEIGETIRIGYFSQESTEMNPAERVIDYIRDAAEYVQTQEGRISASSFLERFLFSPEQQYTPIGKLSGGERRRLQLLRVLVSAPNVLVLDEPTNDIDIPTLAVLEDYLSSFAGIIITVSHDRYFLDNVADRIFAFEEGGRLRQYEGGYTDYINAKRRDEAAGDRVSEKGSGKEASGRASAAPEKVQAADMRRAGGRERLRFSYKEQREYETIDADIAALEEKIAAVDAEMSACASQYMKLSELGEQKEKLSRELEEKMDRWVYLNDLAERIEAQKQV